MRTSSLITRRALLALSAALALGSTADRALAQARQDLVFASIDGTLESVDTGLNEHELMLARWKARKFGTGGESAGEADAEDDLLHQVEEIKLPPKETAAPAPLPEPTESEKAARKPRKKGALPAILYDGAERDLTRLRTQYIESDGDRAFLDDAAEKQEQADGLRAQLDCKSAIPLYLAAEAADPTIAEVQKKLAICYQSIGDTKKAVRRYERYLKTDPADAAKVEAILSTLR